MVVFEMSLCIVVNDCSHCIDIGKRVNSWSIVGKTTISHTDWLGVRMFKMEILSECRLVVHVGLIIAIVIIVDISIHNLVIMIMMVVWIVMFYISHVCILFVSNFFKRINTIRDGNLHI